MVATTKAYYSCLMFAMIMMATEAAASKNLRTGRRSLAPEETNPTTATITTTTTANIVWNITFSTKPSAGPIINQDGTTVYAAAGTNLMSISTHDGSISWQAKLGGSIQGMTWGKEESPLLYLSADNGAVYAFDTSSKKAVWTFTTTNGAFTTGPVLSRYGAVIYAAIESPGAIYAIDVSTGRGLWSFSVVSANNFRLNVVSAPILSPDGEKVYFLDDQGSVHAWATTDGHALWTSSPGGYMSSGKRLAVSPDGKVVFAPRSSASHDGVVAISTENGRMIWRSTPIGYISTSGLTVSTNGSELFFLSKKGLNTLDTHQGMESRSYDRDGLGIQYAWVQGPVLDDKRQRVYFADTSNQYAVYSVDLEGGKMNQVYKMDASVDIYSKVIYLPEPSTERDGEEYLYITSGGEVNGGGAFGTLHKVRAA